jgi:hypothetical protein
MAFTEQEKGRILHFLGYPSWASLAQSIQLGYPAASQPLFLVEDAFNRMTAEGEFSIRKDLSECECVEAQISDARTRLRAQSIGEIKLNKEEIAALRDELEFWSARLASDLGVAQNPYSDSSYKGITNTGGSGVNAKVMG